MNDSLTNKLFIPPWLVSCLAQPWSQSINEEQNYSMSCMHWEHNLLKALTFLIDALQREILNNPGKNNYVIDLKLLQKNLDSYLLRRVNTRKILTDLGGLRFFYEDGQHLKAKNIFSQESFHNSTLEVTIESFQQELILGLFSSYQGWASDKTKQENLRSKFKFTMNPLVLDKALFLDLKNKHTGFVLELAKSDQWHKELVQLPGCFSLNLKHFLSIEKTFARKSLSLKKELKAINKVVRHMNFHGYSKPFSDEGSLFLSDNFGPKVVWQAKNNSSAPLALEYNQKVSTFFAIRTFVNRKNNFFELVAQGNISQELVTFEKKFLDLLKKELVFFTKDSIKDDNGRLLPFIYIFLEICLRSNQKSKQHLSQELLILTKIPALLSIDLLSEYTRIFKKYQETPYLRELIKKESIFCQSPFAIETPEKLTQDQSSTTTYTPSFVTNSKKAYIPQKFLTKQESSLETVLSNDPEEKAREIINQRIVEIRSSSHMQYRKIKDLYYGSLNENSRSTLSTLEKRMRRDLFDQQIQEHLVQYLIERNDSLEIKEILK